MQSASLTPTHERLVLYVSRFCGYCYRVTRVLTDLRIPDHVVELRDVTSDPYTRKEIIEATGRRTVPVLRIPRSPDRSPGHSPGHSPDRSPDRSIDQPGDPVAADATANAADEWLFESREIVRYLRERYGQDLSGSR